MPIYEYYCKVCESKFEVIQKISEQPIKKCEKCKKVGKVVKLLSAPGFRLKGSGWYETDFKVKNKKISLRKMNTGAKRGKRKK